MRSKWKRMLSWLLVLTMMVTLLPTAVFASDAVVDPQTAETSALEGTVPEQSAPADPAPVSEQPAETETPEETVVSGEDAVVSEPVDAEQVESEPVENESAPVETVAAVGVDNGDGTVTFPATAGTPKEVWVRTTTVTDGGVYLIVNSASAGSAKALKNDNGSVASADVTVKTEGTTNYIETSAVTDAIKWTAAGSSTYTFANGGKYLYGDNRGDLSISSSSKEWTVTEDEIKYSVILGSYHLHYSGRSWGLDWLYGNAYLYTLSTITVGATEEVTYSASVTCNGTADAVTENYVTSGTTVQLNAAASPKAPAGGSWTYTSTEESVATVNNSGLVTFAGVEGTTTVKAAYTWTQDGETYTIWDTIDITAVPAGYVIDILDGDKSVDTILVKNVNNGMTRILTYSLEKEAADGNTVHVPENGSIQWTVSADPNGIIRNLDETGTVTFNGGEGTAQIKVTYTAPDGTEYSDLVTVSASKSAYFVPSDGTNDFPEYPNEGAVRIDKNATAVGNFSETGTAQVELSMTGVPYSTGNEIDVVIMLDMSTSMKKSENDYADRVTAARDAATTALDALLLNEDGTVNGNRVALYAFNGYTSGQHGTTQDYAQAVNEVLSLSTYTGASLTTAKDTVTNYIKDANTGSGTNYAAATKKCYDVLNDAKEDYPNRQQYVIFITDGEPTTGFAYVNDDGNVSDMGYSNYTTATLAGKTEYYTTQMKNAGVTVYTVGIQLNDSNAETILKKMAGTKDGNAYTGGKDFTQYAQFIGEDESADGLKELLKQIANKIKQAATNVTVTDKVADEYSVVFETPTGSGLDTQDFYIQVVQYQLDENKERKPNPAVLEKFSYDGTAWKHTVDGEDCEGCTHVDALGGQVSTINGTYFTYNSGTKIITWHADKLDTTELALQYFVHLDNSTDAASRETQVEAGTYPTNDYANIVYTNYLDNECQKVFPVPQMTWNGAQVSYVFYLVNSEGKPVNTAGKVIPFAEAVYVTDPVTYSVIWNAGEGVENMLAKDLVASALLPDVYTLYDSTAEYEINVYAENTDRNNFTITGTGNTTYVFNTKSDATKYTVPGSYTTDEVFTGFDFANTTVAFAVTWVPELVEDTVVLDYGLDVVVDVAYNDALNGSVVGVRAAAPTGVAINKGQFTADGAQTADLTYGTASVENKSAVRYSIKDMEFSAPETFYYESQVSYYNSSNIYTTTNMYSSLTVIPATTVYYEDEYVTLKTYNGTVDNDGQVTYTETSGWAVNSTAVTATQDVDRPGKLQVTEDYDANNVYGYDSAYENMATHSMGSAAMATVSENTYATAEFSFCGTGFDVISMTSNTTGTITVKVMDQQNNVVKNLIVDTYYGYVRGDDGQWVASANNINSLYQVPVMNVTGLEYGKYNVVITAAYNELFDHTAQQGSYDFYLDAIRIYDPTGVVSGAVEDATVSGAYAADGEGWPRYEELRDNVITADTLTAGTDVVEGKVFIDGNGDAELEDYINYGPNNELYLAPGQAVAFRLNTAALQGAADVQLGIKTVGYDGQVSGNVEIFNPTAAVNTETVDDMDVEATTITKTTAYTKSNLITETVSTATDMYYSIKTVAENVIVVYNAGAEGDPVISLTNMKFTYTQAPAAAGALAQAFTISAADAVLATAALDGEPQVETTLEVWDQPFTDVDGADWYVKELKYLHYKDVINGLSNEFTFGPKVEATRAMIVKTLWMIETGGESWTSDYVFVDVAEDSWYADAVAWAYEAGIVKGTGDGTTFEPDKTITRAEIVTMLYRYAQYKGWDVTEAGSLTDFADYGEVDQWAKAALEWAAANEIINGLPDGGKVYIAPTGVTTREQMVAFLYRIVNYAE